MSSRHQDWFINRAKSEKFPPKNANSWQPYRDVRDAVDKLVRYRTHAFSCDTAPDRREAVFHIWSWRIERGCYAT